MSIKNIFDKKDKQKLISFSIKNGGKVFRAEDYATYESFYDDYKKINKSGLQIDARYVPNNKVNR